MIVVLFLEASGVIVLLIEPLGLGLFVSRRTGILPVAFCLLFFDCCFLPLTRQAGNLYHFFEQQDRLEAYPTI
jgi:hypothetical protein